MKGKRDKYIYGERVSMFEGWDRETKKDRRREI